MQLNNRSRFLVLVQQEAFLIFCFIILFVELLHTSVGALREHFSVIYLSVLEKLFSSLSSLFMIKTFLRQSQHFTHYNLLADLLMILI